MYEWQQLIQTVVNEMDDAIMRRDDQALTLRALAARLHYSEYHATHKFREIAGMSLRTYLHQRRLAFALKEVRDTDRPLLDIALDYGFSGQEAFTRAFKALYGVTPGVYRCRPRPVVLRTRIHPFDRYIFGLGEIGMVKSEQGVKTYFVTIPAHKYLHLRNYESNGYWDFWEKQKNVPGGDCATVCGLLDSIPGKLDDNGGAEADGMAGQIMGYINDPKGRLCAWNCPRIESYGVRLPADYSGPIPAPLELMDVPEGEYMVFEHGPFDYEQECRTVEDKVETAMRDFDYAANGCVLDTATPGRMTYFYFVPGQYFKYIRPIRREK